MISFFIGLIIGGCVAALAFAMEHQSVYIHAKIIRVCVVKQSRGD